MAITNQERVGKALECHQESFVIGRIQATCVVAVILEQPMIEKILTHLGLQARAPQRAPARGQALQAA